MDDKTRITYEGKCKDLRAELKRWENEWSQNHAGAKPGRQDIKSNVIIANKYKDYNKYREVLCGKIPPPAAQEPRPTKRKSEPAPAQTPLKKNRRVETPSTERFHDEELMNTPGISRKLFSPPPVTSLGPTPQRDGRVLGLFDLMVEKEFGTPSRRLDTTSGPTPNRSANRVVSTPSRRAAAGNGDDAEKLSRTPMSASKRTLLNTFATPIKNQQGGTDNGTPTSVSKLQFNTPAFLKRHTLPVVDENTMFADPSPLKLPRKPFVRGLSEIVASLRRVEEDVLDDDLEALRDAENETDATRVLCLPNSRPDKEPAILGKNSQARPALLGGFDNEDLYDSPVEDGVDANGNPLPVYKKKGQKRTTRKSNMKPVARKRPHIAAHAQAGVVDGEDVIPETQAVAAVPDGDFAHSDAPENEASARTNADASKNKADGPIKKVAKKFNEMAHANFRRLKLRNHGAKGGPGFGSRFRRRR